MEGSNRTTGQVSHTSLEGGGEDTVFFYCTQNKFENKPVLEKLSQVLPGEGKSGKFEISYQEQLTESLHIRLYVFSH